MWKKYQQSFMKQRELWYDWAVEKTLNFYEKNVLPKDVKLTSLREMKLKEFRERKKLLNPYQRDMMLQQSAKPDEVQKLYKLTNINTMYTFPITFDRHKGKYEEEQKNFKSSYAVYESVMNYKNDPDWASKYRPSRFKIKFLLLMALLTMLGVNWRVWMVEEFDRRKRREQRAMQNKEIQKVQGKKVLVKLRDAKGNLFTQKDLVNEKNEYYLLWYEAKMVNFLGFFTHLHEKKFSTARVLGALIVDTPDILSKIEKIKSESNNSLLKEEVGVYLQEEFGEADRLMRSFGMASSQGEEIELHLNKGFFYLVNPEGRIIDTAKIYSFLHEKNIYKRIMARIGQDVDERISQSKFEQED